MRLWGYALRGVEAEAASKSSRTGLAWPIKPSYLTNWRLAAFRSQRKK